jgi:phosphatidylcholine synthase
VQSSPFRLSDIATCRLIHAFTASGIVVGMLALIAVLDGSPRAAVLLLVVAQLIDGIDGPMARRYDIAEVIPKYDGYILDLVIDYVTCVLVPATFAWQFRVLPHNLVGEVTIAMILTTSAMWFSKKDMMTPDHWFRGFPGVWNMVIPTLWLLGVPGPVAVAVLASLAALSMTDVEFAHPVQAARWRTANITFMGVWITTMVALTIANDEGRLHPVAALLLLAGPIWTAVSTIARATETRATRTA